MHDPEERAILDALERLTIDFDALRETGDGIQYITLARLEEFIEHRRETLRT